MSEIPAAIAAIGRQLEQDAPVVPAAELFADREVFMAEAARLVARPWVAVDHISRLDGDGSYFLFEAATRRIILVRENIEKIHALRNTCLHAGYPVCDAEEGRAEVLHCPFHDWVYGLDGRLIEPNLSAARYGADRLRLARFPVEIDRGLILLDPSTPNGVADAAAERAAVPDWLRDAAVVARRRIAAAWNWKPLYHFLWSRPELLLGGELDRPLARFGALSFLAVGGGTAALVRLVPRFPEQSEAVVVRFAAEGPQPDGVDAVEATLAEAGNGAAADPAAALDRPFWTWYCGLFS
jgi:nitrite reductase/ring-hydroxylating ferredoxin subunit